MENKIESIFTENNYTKESIENGSLFILDQDNKVNFSVAIKSKPSTALKNQNDIFNKCKEICDNPAFDKNCSLLVLWEVDEAIEIEEIKPEILKLEEDPYMFRKYILYYKQSELEGLQNELNNKTLNAFIKENITDTNFFSEYKKNLTSFSLHSLLYRIVFKLPFIKFNIEEGLNLGSLLLKNYEKLGKKDMENDNDETFTLIKDLTADDIEKKDSKDLYDLLKPISGDH